MAIVVITMVDLQCCRCRAKITKILECLKDEFSIEKIEFEDKLNKVIVRGKFDSEKLKTTILCKAGKIVKEIAVVKEWPPPAPPPPPPPPECKCKCKEAILVITMVCLCCACRAKITKILEGLKGEFCIEKIEFEDKLCKVIVRGIFDGEKLKKTISDKAGNLVKEIALVDKWPPPPPPPPTPPPPPPKPECKVVPYPYPYPYPYQPPCHCCKPPPPPKKEEKPPEKPKEEKKEEKPKCCCKCCCKCECPPPKEPEKPKPPPCKCECSHDKEEQPPEKPKPPKDESNHHCPPCRPCPPCPPNYWPPPPHCHCPEQDSQCSIM